jgi:salicylate hydroxylase
VESQQVVLVASALRGAPNLTVHRAGLLGVLRGALKTVDCRFGARCISVEEGDRGGVARFADGSEIEIGIIVGADGIHSVVRKNCPASTRRDFTGCICWRGMAAASAVRRDIPVAEGAMVGPHGHVVHWHPAIARHPNDLDRALLTYERVRAPRARAAVLGSRERAREN